jgi:hypothetical protein
LAPSSGISSTVLAALMGHESSTITERRYVDLFDSRFLTLINQTGSAKRPTDSR